MLSASAVYSIYLEIVPLLQLHYIILQCAMQWKHWDWKRNGEPESTSIQEQKHFTRIEHYLHL